MSKDIPGLGLRTEAPKLSAKADLAHARLTPQEGFVLSRIDGRTSIGEICMISGLGEEATIAVLRKLRAAGIIVTSAPPAAAKTGAPPAAAKTGAPPAAADEASCPVPPLADGDFDAALLEDGPDLPPEIKRRILSFHLRLRELDHFQRLEVSRQADRQEIRRAYFRLCKEFHPDRYYGADVGGYRERLSEIFKALAKAFEVLSRDEERARYLARLTAAGRGVPGPQPRRRTRG